MNARWSLHGSPPCSSPFLSASTRASRPPGRPREIAFRAGVLVALLLSLVLAFGAINPARSGAQTLPDIDPGILSVIPLTANPGDTIRVQWQDINASGIFIPATTSWTDDVYLSPNTEPGGTLLFSHPMTTTVDISPYSGKTGDVEVAIPAGTAPGSYHIVVVADSGDAGGSVTEANEDNNVASSAFTVLEPVANTAPDILFDSASPISVGQTFEGAGHFYDPDGNVQSATVDYGDGSGVANLDFSEYAPYYPFTFNHIYITAGTFTVTVTVTDGMASDSDTLEVTVNAPDLTVTYVNVDPASPAPGDTVTVLWGLHNAGPGTILSTARWTDTVYLSDDGILGDDVWLADSPVALTQFIAPNTGKPNGVSVTIPASTAPGDYTIFVVADSGDAGGSVIEANEDNNVGSTTFAVAGTVTNNPPAVTLGEDAETISLGEVFEGFGSFTDADTGDSHTARVDYGDETGEDLFLDFGSFYFSHTYAAPGTYTLTVTVSDGTDSGTDTMDVTVDAPDIVPIVYSDDAVAPGDTVTIDWEDTNAGPGSILSGTTWTDSVYLSDDATFGDDDDVWLADEAVVSTWRTGSGASVPGAVDVTVPELASGDYTIFVVADAGDAGGSVIEADESNNVGSATLTISRPPIADAGGPYTAVVGESITLDGSGSSDPEGDVSLTYEWDLDYDGTNFYWTHEGATPSVTYTTAGDYTIALRVRDSTLLYSEIATTTVKVTEPVTSVDLMPADLTVLPSTAAAGDELTVTWSVRNAGDDDTPDGVGWDDHLYLSRNDVLVVGEDPLIASSMVGGPLAAAATYPELLTHSFTVDASLEPGTWFVILETDGEHLMAETDEANNTLAQQITIVAPVQGVDLVPDTLVFTPASAVPGDQVGVTWSVRNGGTSPLLRGYTDAIYLSTNDTLDASDARVFSWYTYTPPAPGEGVSSEEAFGVPQVIPAGAYYVILQVDYYNNIAETNEGNNVLVADGQLTISGGTAVDLEPTSFTVDPIEANPDAQVKLTYTVANNGPDALPAEVGQQDLIFLSRDEVIDEDDWFMASDGTTEPVDANGSYTRTLTGGVPWNAEPGPAYLILSVNHNDDIVETDGSNNVMVIPFTVTEPVQGVDLEPTALNAEPDAVGGNETLTVTWSVQNAGPDDIAAGGFWYDMIYLSRNAQVGYDDIALGLQSYNAVSGLASGVSYDGSTSVTVPLGVASGEWYVLLETDSWYGIDETDEADNLMVFGPITVTPLDVDLEAVSIATTTSTIDPGGPISYEYTVRNNGVGTVPAGYWWVDGIYLSANDTFERSLDFEIKVNSAPVVSLPNEMGNTYTVAATLNIGFEVPGGDYHLILVVDAFEEVAESNEANNVIASTSKVTVGALDVDLEPYEWVTAPPATAGAGATFQLQVAVRNNGAAGIPLAARWNDEAYLSVDQTFDPLTDAQIGYGWGGGINLVNGVYTGTVDVSIPMLVADGPWYVLYVANPWFELAETNDANNVLASAPIMISGGTSVDLAVQSAVPTPSAASPGDGVTLAFTVVNNGPNDLAAGIEIAYAVAYSTDATLDQGDLPLAMAATHDGLSVGGTYSDSLAFTLPASVPEGDGYLFMLVDISSEVVELNETNNMMAIPFTIGVSPNTAPIVAAGDDATIDEGGTFDSTGSFTDPDADNWTATVDYGDGSGEQTLTGKAFNLIHTYAQDGTYTVTVTVNDGTVSATDTVAVTVSNVLPMVEAGADATVDENALFEQMGSFVDPGEDTWTVEVDYDGDAVADETFTPNPDKTFPLSHIYTDPGSYTVTVTVFDDDGSSSDTLILTVEALNTTPVVTLGDDATIDEGSLFERTGSFEDPDDNSWTVKVDYDGDFVVDETITPNADKTFTLSHTYMQDGVYTVTVTVNDGTGTGEMSLMMVPVGGPEGVATMQVTVNNVAPVVEVGEDGTIQAGDTLTRTISFTDPGADTWAVAVDYDGDETADETGTPAADKTYGLSHAYSDVGTYIVTVTVTDDDGGVGSDELLVTVSELNVAPVVGLVTVDPGTQVEVGTAVTVSASFTDANPADTHTVTVNWDDKTITDPAGMSGGTVSASHTYAKQGTYIVTVTVTEERPDALSGSATTSVTVTKAARNVAPVAVPGGPYSGVEDVTIPLDGSGSYDTDGNTPLGCAWDTSYDGKTFNTDLTGASPAVTYPDPGTYTIALQVTDGLGVVSKIATTTVVVVPVDANAAPVVGPVAVAPGTEVQVGTAVTVSASFNDANAGDTHTGAVDWGDKTITDPAGMSGGTLSASHTYAKQGRYTVTVTVSDGDLNGSASTVIQVTKPPKETTTFDTQQAPVVEEPTVAPAPEPTPIPTPEPTPIPAPTVVPEPTIVPETTSEPEAPVDEPTPPLETEGVKDKKN